MTRITLFTPTLRSQKVQKYANLSISALAAAILPGRRGLRCKLPTFAARGRLAALRYFSLGGATPGGENVKLCCYYFVPLTHFIVIIIPF